MVVTAEITPGQLADLIKQIQAGNEVVLTQHNMPVARLVAAAPMDATPSVGFQIRSFKGHQVLMPVISQQDLADELFADR